MTTAMIKIDGNRIKAIRESQGLTQLYLATAVEVTTDTISRWENKRYPTIKEENGLKLAEALGVQLDEILLQELVGEKPPLSHTSLHDEPSAQFSKHPLLAGLLLATITLIVALLGVFHFNKKVSTIQANRVMPAKVISGSPFPIVVVVRSSSKNAISLILKETLPTGAIVRSVTPRAGVTPVNNELKWVQKIGKSEMFSYLVTLSGKEGENLQIQGTVKTIDEEQTIVVKGQEDVLLANTHWADTDGDNKISDQEILTVFDRYGDLDALDINIEQIEKIWLGSGYTLNQQNNLITISE